MLEDREAFARAVHQQLGALAPVSVPNAAGEGVRDQYQDSEEHLRCSLEWMAEESLRFIQRQEALCRAPTLDEFGRAGFVYRASVLSPDIDTAWSTYQRVIEAVQHSPAMPPDKQESQASTRSLPGRSEEDSPPMADAQSDRKPFWRRLFGSQ